MVHAWYMASLRWGWTHGDGPWGAVLPCPGSLGFFFFLLPLFICGVYNGGTVGETEGHVVVGRRAAMCPCTWQRPGAEG